MDKLINKSPNDLTDYRIVKLSDGSTLVGSISLDKEFLRIQKEQYELFCKKQMDYGPSNIAMGSGVGKNINTRLSLVGLIVRTNDKIQRLLNLVVNNNREAQNEPIEDAFKDLSVYGIIAQIVKNGKWGI